MAAIANGGLFTKQSLIVPRHDVRNTDLDRDDATGAGVFLDGTSLGDVLHNPLLAALRFGAATTGCAEDVNGCRLVALGSISAAHQYHPVFSLWAHASHGVA